MVLYDVPILVLNDDPARRAFTCRTYDLITDLWIVGTWKHLPCRAIATMTETGLGATKVIPHVEAGTLEELRTFDIWRTVGSLITPEPSVGTITERSVVGTTTTAKGIHLRLRQFTSILPSVFTIFVRDGFLIDRHTTTDDVRTILHYLDDLLHVNHVCIHPSAYKMST